MLHPEGVATGPWQLTALFTAQQWVPSGGDGVVHLHGCHRPLAWDGPSAFFSLILHHCFSLFLRYAIFPLLYCLKVFLHMLPPLPRTFCILPCLCLDHGGRVCLTSLRRTFLHHPSRLDSSLLYSLYFSSKALWTCLIILLLFLVVCRKPFFPVWLYSHEPGIRSVLFTTEQQLFECTRCSGNVGSVLCTMGMHGRVEHNTVRAKAFWEGWDIINK